MHREFGLSRERGLSLLQTSAASAATSAIANDEDLS